MTLSAAVQAYFAPIRSVLVIDDQFPEYGTTDGSEADRAKSIWTACRDRGWICDFTNSLDPAESKAEKRLGASDLIVLDYHLIKDDPSPALKIVRHLAMTESPCFLVVYTADPDPANVLLTLAAQICGVEEPTTPIDDSTALEAAALKIEWSRDDVFDYLRGKDSWMKTYRESVSVESKHLKAMPIGENVLRDFLRKSHLAPVSIKRVRIDGYRAGQGVFRVHAGNMFLVVARKADETQMDAESSLFDALKEAIDDWNPDWMTCLLARSRQVVQAGSFRDDVRFQDTALISGLLHYIRVTEWDSGEAARRSREIASYILRARFDTAERELGKILNERATGEPGKPTTEELLQLNAYLCSDSTLRHHIRTGTIFEVEGQLFVCVTPACDMVPRAPSGTHAWLKSLHPCRPMLALRLERLVSASAQEGALLAAEQGRFLFFFDVGEKKPVACKVLAATDDPNPVVEQLFVANAGKLEGGQAQVTRCVSDKAGGVTMQPASATVRGQLRAPHAERLTQIVGAHLSRVGVNFVNAEAPPTRKPC